MSVGYLANSMTRVDHTSMYLGIMTTTKERVVVVVVVVVVVAVVVLCEDKC